MSKIVLTDKQVTAVIKLIDDEIERNKSKGDDGYNTYWDNVRKEFVGKSA